MDLDYWRGGSFCIKTGTGGAQYNVDTNKARPKPDTASACPAGYFKCDNSARASGGKGLAYDDKLSKGVCYPGTTIGDCPLTDLDVGTTADAYAETAALTALLGTADISSTPEAPYKQFDLTSTTIAGKTVGYIHDSLVTHAQFRFSYTPAHLPGS